MEFKNQSKYKIIIICSNIKKKYFDNVHILNSEREISRYNHNVTMYNALFFIHYTSFFDMLINNSMSFIIQLEIYIKIPINNTVQSSKLNQIVSVIHLEFLTMTNFSYSLILIV